MNISQKHKTELKKTVGKVYVLFVDKHVNNKTIKHEWKLHRLQVSGYLWGEEMGQGCRWALSVSVMFYFF